MADAPVDSLRRLLLAPELDEYRTRFLAAVVVMDKQKVAQFEDIPQHCYDQLEALVQTGDAGCGAEVEGSVGVFEDGAAVAASGQDIHDDRDCEATAVVATALVPEDEVPEDKDREITVDTATAVAAPGGDIYEGAACEMASENETPEDMGRQTTAPAPAATLNGDIHKEEITTVASNEHTYEDTTSKILAPENHNHENTACENMVAVVSVIPAATPEHNIHEDKICEITTVDHAHNGTASKILTPDNHIHEACEISAAVAPAADMDTTSSEDYYARKYTASEITVPDRDCTHESKSRESTTLKNYTVEATVCEIPPATTRRT